MKISEIITEWTDSTRAKKYNPDSRTYGKDYEQYAMPHLNDPVMDKSVGFQDVDQDELMYEPDLEQPSMDAALKSKIENAIKGLTVKERAVLTLIYGLNGHDEHTLVDVSEHLGISPGRVKQIEAKALRKFLHPTRSDSLRGHLED